MIDKLKSLCKTIFEIDRKVDELRFLQGCIACNQLKFIEDNSKPHEFKCFSQWGEDGIIQWLINNIAISRKIFIEFGTQNYTESNTRFLLMHDNWAGLVIDGDESNINYIRNDEIYWRYNLKAVQCFITAENINTVFKENGIVGEIGILSVDIDGNDYWVWKAIEVVAPDIVICEYNHRFGTDKAITIPYDPMFTRDKGHYSCIYYGASIRALSLLGESKGYSLVAGNSNGNNIFFVKNKLLNNIVKKKDVEEVFAVGRFRESRNEYGKLAFLDAKEEEELLKSLDYVDVAKV